jgi:hypothetical protein
MLTKWQFNVLFFVGVGSVVLLLIGPTFGLEVSDNPTALTGVGLILTYVLTQKKSWVKDDDDHTGDQRKDDSDVPRDT